jgi:hypothetical protein
VIGGRSGSGEVLAEAPGAAVPALYALCSRRLRSPSVLLLGVGVSPLGPGRRELKADTASGAIDKLYTVRALHGNWPSHQKLEGRKAGGDGARSDQRSPQNSDLTS